MTSGAAKRLRLAKRAAKDCLANGGSNAAAAAAAQAFGTPCGDNSDVSDDDEDHEQTLVSAVEEQLVVTDGSPASSEAPRSHAPMQTTSGQHCADDVPELT